MWLRLGPAVDLECRSRGTLLYCPRAVWGEEPGGGPPALRVALRLFEQKGAPQFRGYAAQTLEAACLRAQAGPAGESTGGVAARRRASAPPGPPFRRWLADSLASTISAWRRQRLGQPQCVSSAARRRHPGAQHNPANAWQVARPSRQPPRWAGTWRSPAGCAPGDALDIADAAPAHRAGRSYGCAACQKRRQFAIVGAAVASRHARSAAAWRQKQPNGRSARPKAPMGLPVRQVRRATSQRRCIFLSVFSAQRLLSSRLRVRGRAGRSSKILARLH